MTSKEKVATSSDDLDKSHDKIKSTSFKSQHSLEKRQKESSRIRTKFPDRIPVIVEKHEKSAMQDLDKKKFLVPEDLTLGQFMYVLRKRVKMDSKQAIYLFVNGGLIPVNTLLIDIYEKNKDIDNFLYCTISLEDTFGSI
jgi:GABA(A) receptor-associated protein